MHSIVVPLRPVTDKAERIRFTLSCLAVGVAQGRRKVAADRLAAQHQANTTARWQG